MSEILRHQDSDIILATNHGEALNTITDLRARLILVETERDRMRAALENIAQSLRLSWFTKENAREIAKAALEGRP